MISLNAIPGLSPFGWLSMYVQHIIMVRFLTVLSFPPYPYILSLQKVFRSCFYLTFSTSIGG